MYTNSGEFSVPRLRSPGGLSDEASEHERELIRFAALWTLSCISFCEDPRHFADNPFPAFGALMASTTAVNDIVQQAEAMFHQGHYASAAELLSDAISTGPSALLWNDWAAVQVTLGQLRDAERGFRAALQLDPTSTQAMENLGALLFARGCHAEAARWLQQVLPYADAQKKVVIEDILAACSQAGDSSEDPSASAPVPGVPVDSLSSTFAANGPATPWDNSISYDQWCRSAFRQPIPVPGVRLVTSWSEDSEWGKRAYNALARVECEYVTRLLMEIRDQQIAGDIAEFGIFEGWWINFLHQISEQIGLPRRVYGFDSFQGLSDPHPEHDQAFWKKGQYTCSYEQVCRNVQVASRPRIKLVKGFFEKSLRSAEALVAEKFAYVRIDCDIYLPALDCLRYLGPRLADGAILVFDDWPHERGCGEQRALEEWLPTVPQIELEFLFYGAIGHFYTRVHHKK